MARPTYTMQDIGSLEQYDDVATWINDMLDSPDETVNDSALPAPRLTELDQQITQLVTTLDIAAEDTSSQLERIIADISRGIPRLTYDLHFMKDGASSLQTVLADILHKSKEVIPQRTNEALDTLNYLDTVKTRMEASREVLREAESWSTLELEVTSLIAEQSFVKAAERLSEANKSMVVFQNTVEYDTRRTLLVNLQNQLEASLSSSLVSAINAHDTAICRDYFSIFSIIQRESEFRNYYNAARRAPVIATWQSAQLIDCDSSTAPLIDTSSQLFSDFIAKFYSEFLSVLNTERTPICSIFPDPAITLSQFISSTLSSLQPTFPHQLSSIVSYYGDSSLTHLISTLQATENFALEVEKVMEKVKYAVIPPIQQRPSLTDKSQGHVRRRSSRMSMSWRPGHFRSSSGAISGSSAAQELLESLEWEQELFQPFLDLQVDYASLERRFLDGSFTKIIRNSSRDKVHDVDLPRLFRERAVDVFGIAEGSLNRCKAFTHGYGAVGLVQALDGFLQSFIDSWTAEMMPESSDSSPSQTSVSDVDLTDLDYSSRDWVVIQLTIHLLASSRTVYDRLAAFEMKLRLFLSQIAMQFRLALGNPSEKMIATSKGESQLLEQSTLNSAELQTLLDSVGDTPNVRDAMFSPPLSTNLRQSLPQSSSHEVLLSNARGALSNFAQKRQSVLQDTILSPLRDHLASYSSSAIWNVPGDPKKRTVGNDLQVPTFSLSPSETVQKVAEGLLNLPRLFEVYADDDALAFSLQTLPYLDAEISKVLLDHNLEGPAQPTHRRRTSLVLAKPSMLDPEVVSSAWLLSLGHTFLHHLAINILPAIPALSLAGAAQLSTDLEYLSNIVRALNVEHDGLEKWRMYVAMGEEEIKRLLEDGSEDPILNHIARVRGWKGL